jgi:hypothetical protein
MNNLISRAILLTLFCFGLAGCSVGTRTTNLKDVPSQPEETRLLGSVGYVFHDEVYATKDRKSVEIVKRFIESERKSWVDALTGFTVKENIFIMSNGIPTNPNNSYPEFAKTHPIVHVYVKAAPEGDSLTMDDVVNEGPFWLTFLSFGLTPAYLPIPYTASFTLSMPEDSHTPPSHWDYAYEREEYYWLPLLIPMEEYLDSIDDQVDIDRWKTEEKRRLLLKFLQDAKPLLQAR